MRSESLVVIRTFRDLVEADEAQIALMTAGIYALVFTEDAGATDSGQASSQRIALAVHRRDVSLAEGALTAQPHPA